MTSNQPLETAPALPWWRRVLPLTAVLLVVAALAVGLVPPLRDQFLLSASHRESSYVEMAFVPDDAGLVQPCVAATGVVEVHFAMAGHGESAGDRSWRVRLSDPTGKQKAQTLKGTTRLPDNAPVGVRRLVRWSGAYELVVTLPGTTQRLVAHCEVAR